MKHYTNTKNQIEYIHFCNNTGKWMARYKDSDKKVHFIGRVHTLEAALAAQASYIKAINKGIK